MGRAPCCDKASVKKGPWSPEEDAKLKSYIEKHGTGGNWIALPQKIGLKRCGKSCRLRWLNYLRPNIKHGGFTEEEDNIICSLYISIGSRWSIIAAQLPGRTDNDIKNYWNTRLKKKLLGKRKQSQMNRLLLAAANKEPNSNNNNNEDNTNLFLQNLSNSALERLQLHMQLQGLQNPFSLFNNNTINNPSILQQQAITMPSDHNNNNNNNNNLEIVINDEHQQQQPCSTTQDDNMLLGQLEGFSQSEMESLLMNNGSSEFDCFKQTIMENGSKEVMGWWNTSDGDGDEFVMCSSNSWVSTPMLPPPHDHSHEGMFHEYASLGYNHI